MLLGLYTGFGVLCLRLTNTLVNRYTVAGFVISGGVAGLVSFMAYGVMLEEEYGLLGEGDKVISMFVVATIISVVVSIGTAKIIAAYKR